MKTKSYFLKLITFQVFLTCFTAIAPAQNITDKKQIENLLAKNISIPGWRNSVSSEYRIANSYRDEQNGIAFIYLQQTYKGFDINKAIQTLMIKKDSIHYFAGQFFNTENALLNTYKASPSVTASNAVLSALKYLNLIQAQLPVAIEKNEAGTKIKFGNIFGIQNNITATLTWLQHNEGKKLSLCWQVEIQPRGKQDFYLVYIDAVNAASLAKENLAVNCSWNNNDTQYGYIITQKENKNYRQTIKQSIEGNSPPGNINTAAYNVIKFPAASPLHSGGSPSTDTNPWERIPPGNGADKYKWNADDLNTYDSTKGNNVLAHEDVGNTNYYGRCAKSSSPLPNLTFNFAPDFTKEPGDSSNQRFAITNLFYWNNIMHDISYIYGFNEAAGNFQQNNKHSSGIGGDFVYADAQDGASANSASFLTPVDGVSPRMQLSLFNGNPKIDPSLDNEVICHEYTHGISNRLVGGAGTVNCLQNEEQMGEGWSDYFALMITTDWAKAKPGDGIKKRSIATYSLGQLPEENGVRIHPYSTDMTIDPWTYADLPNVPATGGFPSPHAVGEIWCSVLWDITWALIDETGITPNIYNFTENGGNIIAMNLVTFAMKLTSCSPGFYDAKRAMLSAEEQLYNKKYNCILKKAFARRGMGGLFSQGNPLSYKDGTADFTEPVSAKVFVIPDKDTIEEGSIITYALEAKGSTCGGVVGYTIKDTLSPQLLYVNGGIYNEADKSLNFSNINLGENEDETVYFSAAVKGGTYYPPVQHINEPVPDPVIPPGWVTYNIAGTNKFTVNSTVYSAPFAFYVSGPSTYSVSVLETKDAFLLSGKSTFSFWQNYTTENLYDGGVAEISTDSGITWIDLGDYFYENGYDTTISGQYGSYLAGRKAFCGKSNGYIQSKADLTAFNGQYVKLRFLFASDIGGTSKGWNVDDILFKSEAAIINKASIFNSAGTLTYYSTAVSLITPGVLAEKWGLFTAEKNNSTAVLQWQFLQNENTAKFSIERSVDGLHFISIGVVQYIANTVNFYFTDNHPLPQINYYRIRQTNVDGQTSHSPIKLLNFSSKLTINVSPNPAKHKLFININCNTQPFNIILFTTTGKVINTYKATGNVAILNLPKISPGMYFLKIIGAAFTSTHKLIIE